MNQENRKNIETNIDFLAKNTSSLPVLLNSFQQAQILVEFEIQKINSKSTEYEKQTELYNTLIKKEDNNFDTLLLILEESGNKACAEKISNNSPSRINGLIWFNVKPPTTMYYKGRDEEMKKMESYWKESSGEKILFVAVTGLGGVGKTEFATKFANDFYKVKKGHCFWIDSETNQTIYNSFQALAPKIGISLEDHEGKDKSIQILTHQVYEKVLEHSNEKCLFIFDNIENYEETVLASLVEFTNKLDSTKLRPFVILTSRCELNHQVFGDLGKNLSLDMLSEKSALEFFEEALQINRNEEKAILNAKLVSKKLNYYPLAMQQAVAFIKSQSHFTDDVTTHLESYLDSYENNRKKLLQQNLPKLQDDASKTTYLTWQVTREKIDQRAKDVLDIISFFHSDNIDISFIHQIMERMFPESEIKSIFETLRSYSFCQKEDDKSEVYYVHRIVQDVIQILLDDEEKLVVLLDKLMGIMNEILCGKNKILCPRFQNQLIHVEKVWNCASERKILLEKHTEFPFNIVNQYINIGRYKEAEEFSNLATKRLESELREESRTRTTLRMKSMRGKAQEKLGQSKEILVELKEVYKNQKQLTGEDNDVDNRLHTATLIGKLYWRRGKYKKAIDWLTSVLEERRKVIHGEKSEATLSLKHDIAVILDVQGKYDDSLKMFQEGLALKKELLPDEHPDILSTVQWIGVVKRHQHKYKEAKIAFYDVLCKRSKILGKNHPDTLSTMQNIGMVLDYEAKYPEAELMYNEVLTTQKAVLGEDHRDTLSTLTSIGHLKRHQGNLDEALENYEQVLQVKQEELGDEHPDSLDAMTNIALAKCQQGDIKKALEIYDNVLAVRKQVLGNKHPSTLLTMNNIANIKDMLGGDRNYKEAIDLYEEVLTLAEGVLGQDDPDIWTTKFNIGIVKYHQGKLKDALELYEEVKTMREEILGKDHPDTKTTVNSIANVKKEMNTFQFKIKERFFPQIRIS